MADPQDMSAKGKAHPATKRSDVHSSTIKLLAWLKKEAAYNNGFIPPFSNAQAATEIGLGDLKIYGQVQGNIQSRIDFACYLCDLPPLGCAAEAPFKNAWRQRDRTWAFPSHLEFQRVTQGRQWAPEDFERVQAAVTGLPGRAHILWRDEMTSHEQRVRAWANRCVKTTAASQARQLEKRLPHRLPATTLSRATPEFIWIAVQRFVIGNVSHSFGPSIDFDLITCDGHRFPPKAVFGLALSVALGRQDIGPSDFSGGEDSPCFRLLRAAGYSIVGKGEALSSEIPPAQSAEWREGKPRLRTHMVRERAAGLVQAKKAQYLRVHGKLTCEQCNLDPVAHYQTEDAQSCIEVHHAATLVSKMDPGHITTLDDLQCLCANCHRLVHRIMNTTA